MNVKYTYTINNKEPTGGEAQLAATHIGRELLAGINRGMMMGEKCRGNVRGNVPRKFPDFLAGLQMSAYSGCDL